MLTNLSPTAPALALPTADRSASTALAPQSPLPPVDAVGGSTAQPVEAGALASAAEVGVNAAPPSGPQTSPGALSFLSPATQAAPPSREPGTQTRIGELQQGEAYLQRLAQALQDVKRQLSGTLAQSGEPAPALQRAVAELDTLWRAREREAGGQVDAQLQAADGAQPVQQRFRIRGLDAASLSAGGSEVLRWRLSGQPGAVRVPLDSADPAAGLSALRQALAPAGLQVQQDGADLWFSVDEARWPAVRDSLTVQGDGRRFPGGQPVRPVIDPQPSAIDATRWKLGTTTEQRQTLRSVVQAQSMVDQAQGRLADRRNRLVEREPAPALDRARASQSAGQVQAQLQGADYVQLAAVVPALRGLHGARVRQILSA